MFAYLVDRKFNVFDDCIVPEIKSDSQLFHLDLGDLSDFPDTPVDKHNSSNQKSSNRSSQLEFDKT